MEVRSDRSVGARDDWQTSGLECLLCLDSEQHEGKVVGLETHRELLEDEGELSGVAESRRQASAEDGWGGEEKDE
ncbi:MAG: hypothetical protein IPF66_24850 [Holophagales bacterium]|nr:hypothetical protein [Holophagales bacterium]